MKIVYHKTFEKKFKKLSKAIQNKIIKKVTLFSKDPFAKELSNHALQGRMAGKRAFSVTGNYRIIFEEIDDYVLVIMLDVGTHTQVY